MTEKKPTLVTYIAGKFRGDTPWDVERNIREAEVTAFSVWSLSLQLRGGFVAALCPHTMNRHWDKTLSDEIWLAGGLELLRRCDAVVLVDNWQYSTGAIAEVRLALSLDIPVFCSWEGDACNQRAVVDGEPGKFGGVREFLAWAQKEIDGRRDANG